MNRSYFALVVESLIKLYFSLGCCCAWHIEGNLFTDISLSLPLQPTPEKTKTWEELVFGPAKCINR